MKFNRQLFKEAYKAGYKKAKFLNEDKNKGRIAARLSKALTEKYGDFFLEADYFRRTGDDFGAYDGKYRVVIRAYEDELQFQSLPLGKIHTPKNFRISGNDLKNAEPISEKEARVLLKNGDFFNLRIYVITNPNEIL